eukprot:CAMPEP_0196592200 /NCGR_PEP_ID=MMETSP1081-20130531/72043_1 /TAXON_ID=36882 /ORGANISM="Pyramimonas amylifera, Strain CCMP720" /LENGTH=80 /DNA_ID=CAMNT_0041915811 /DNA_START=660 /DNA_END=901 /DNA_ORIENTATION=+
MSLLDAEVSHDHPAALQHPGGPCDHCPFLLLWWQQERVPLHKDHVWVPSGVTLPGNAHHLKDTAASELLEDESWVECVRR